MKSLGSLAAIACLTMTGAAANAGDMAKKPPPSAQDENESPRGGDERNVAPREAPGAERDPELIDPGPDGCPFNDQQLELIV